MTTPAEEESELYDMFKGKTLTENLQNIVAGACTGYSYADLETAINDGEDLLDTEEIMEVDSAVNLLAHLFKAHLKAQQQTLLERIDAEVIGKDRDIDEFVIHDNKLTVLFQNDLRTEQRKALSRIKGELGEGAA